LWGIDDGLQALSRLPDFTLYTLRDTQVAKTVVKRGTELGDAIDLCIKDCYLNGRAPNFYERTHIKFLEWRFRRARNKYKKSKKTE